MTTTAADLEARRAGRAAINIELDRIKSETDALIGAPTNMRDNMQTYARRSMAHTALYLAETSANADLTAAGEIRGDRTAWTKDRTADHLSRLTVALNEDGLVIIVEREDDPASTPDDTTVIDSLAQSAADVEAAQSALTAAQQQRRTLIDQALAAGMSPTTIAETAGVTRRVVYDVRGQATPHVGPVV